MGAKVRRKIAVTIEGTQEEQDVMRKEVERRQTEVYDKLKKFVTELKEQQAAAVELEFATSKRKIVNAYDTALWQLEEIYMREQEGRGNSEHTLIYYRNIWRRIYQFLTFHTTKTADAYGELIDEDNDDVGKLLPIMVLQMDDFQQEFRYYLLHVRGNSEQTIQKNMRGLRAIMKFVKENGWLETPHITVRDIEPPIKNTYSERELEVLSRKPDPDNFVEYRNWLIVRYTMATGNRAGSIAELKVGDIDFDEGYVNVNTMKGKNPIRLPLVREIERELREYIAFYRSDDDGEPLYDQPLFITQFEEPMTAAAISKAFRKFCIDRGLSKTSIHLLRHTYAKRYIVDGGDVLSLKAMLGHKSLKMVNHYARIYGVDIRDKVEKHGLIGQTKVKAGSSTLFRTVC